MSGNAQGLPQRMTAFVDPKTGLVSDTWWRFLQALYQRTGGAEGGSTTDEIIQYNNMADVPLATPPEGAAWLATAMADVPAAPQGGFVDPMGDVPPAPSPEAAAWLAAAIADAPTPPPPEITAWMAMADVPSVPENDPALIAMMVS